MLLLRVNRHENEILIDIYIATDDVGTTYYLILIC